MKFKLGCLSLGIACLISGCGPSEAEQIATITQIAAGIIATQMAQAPTATSAPPTPTAPPNPGATQTSPVDGMTMVYIPPGEYTLGSSQEEVDWALEAYGLFLDDGDSSAFLNEMPQHCVQLDPFWIDMTEVTNAMFAAFIDESGYETQAERFEGSYVFYEDGWDLKQGATWLDPLGLKSGIDDLMDHPVVNVSWHDAIAYCEWAGRRLPTEAEWEAAARGMDLRVFPWGNKVPIDEQANLYDRSIRFTSSKSSWDFDGYEWTSPVMNYPEGASPFGVLGMAGNVEEWVFDGYAPSYSLPTASVNPVNNLAAENRVIRGGSYTKMRTPTRTANRAGNNPNLTASDLGFRCAFSDIALQDPPAPDSSSSLPDVALLDWRTTVFLSPGSSDVLGYLKSIESRQITGQYHQCKYLRISTNDIEEGWLNVDQSLVLNKDCSEMEEIFIRPASASWKYLDPGFGTLTVKNLGEADAYLVLVNPQADSNYQMYVRAGESAIMDSIPDGTYEVYLTTGTVWVSYERRFKDAASYEILQEPLVFTSNATQATTWEIVLQTTEVGNAGSVRIDESDFPSP